MFLVLLGTFALFLTLPANARAQGSDSGAQDRQDRSSEPSGINDAVAKRAMESFRAARMAGAEVQTFVAPFASIRGTQEAELVLISRFAEAFDVSVKAVEWNGRIITIDNLTIQPRQRIVLNLRETLEAAGLRMKEGSLRVEHFGDSGMLQSWIVFTNAHGQTATPLLGPGSTGREATSFWSLGWPPEPKGPGRSTRAAYVLHNRDATPLRVEVSTSRPGRGGVRDSYDLRPDSSVLVRPDHGRDFQNGTITFEHDGAEGQLAVAGLLLSPTGVVSSLPVADRATLEKLRTFSSAGVPGDDEVVDAGSSLLAVHDARTEGRSQTVTADVLEFETGAILKQYRRQLAPGGVVVFDELTEDLATAFRATDWRLRLDAEAFGIVPYFAVFSQTEGSITEVELLSHSKSHPNGTYPLPSPQEATANAVLLNIGDEPSEIFAHIVTDRGEYALDPFTIPADGAYDLDFNALIAQGTPDRIGRRISADFESGFFQWMSRGPGFELLARTNVSRSGAEDVIGFNCFGCCAEFPAGAVYPESTYVFTGESAFLEAQVYVDTCAGTTGPYPANVTSRSYTAPITWFGTSVNTTGETEQDVGFSGEGLYMSPTCKTVNRSYLGFGVVGFFTNCQEKHNPGRNGFDSCQQQPKPGETCPECCDKQRKVGNCICGKLPFGSAICEAFVGHGYRNCISNCTFV